MQVEFQESFLIDISKIKDDKLRDRISKAIDMVRAAGKISDIVGIKKLRGSKSHFRIRVGNHRIGLAFQQNMMVFVRCLDRKDIYKYFPE